MINMQIKHEQLTVIQINATQNVSAIILKNKTAVLQKDKKKMDHNTECSKTCGNLHTLNSAMCTFRFCLLSFYVL